ncbi:site-specific integrase [Halorubrum sp. JWXQ-INN 858]|uniref:tyrosine-type recombinase/integrase n=1 Tax=Halorubrum sp. JWXQ-INN 858 TaxID=2690782 RepID=UPI001358514F|nr:site-specific integrase [Halorubrum sp. JWXQ-INN 858]MWV65532.1 site-specific integrase [Halorubrum sp. JWXQ-INN 858]
MSRRRTRRRDPGALAPREAVSRYLQRRRADATDASVQSWKYRLKLFVEWCESVGIQRVDDIRGYDLDDYYEIRSGGIAPATLEGEMWTLQRFVEYLEQIEAVDPNLSDSVRIPDLDDSDRANSETLPAEKAIPLIEFYRRSDEYRATRGHAFLELAWFTGARQGGIRALDVRDLYDDDDYVEFHHRPKTGTPLKNKLHGERPVAVPPKTMDVLREYVGNRYDVRDDHGRQPLITSQKGRPGVNTVRMWSYLATQPCLHGPCPHGETPETCEMREFAHASKCPSSRSPHRIRTGSITWQLNCGVPPETVAERVNATVKTIKKHYDWATERERWRRHHEQLEGRRDHLQKFEFDHE